MDGEVEVARERLGLLDQIVGRGRVPAHVVQQQDARHPEFPHLKGEEQLSLEGPGVGHQEDDVRVMGVVRIEERALGDAAVLGLGVEVVNARQVVEEPMFGTADLARGRGRGHGHAGQIPHRHRGAREALKQGGFPCVGVADKRNLHGCKGRRFVAMRNPLNGPFEHLRGSDVIWP